MIRADNAAMQTIIVNELKRLALISTPSQDVSHTHRDLSQVQASSRKLIEPRAAQERDETQNAVAQCQRPRALKRRENQRSEWRRIRISFSAWLTGRIWDVATRRSRNGWTCTLQTWRVVPNGSPIFDSCVNGDINVVKNLILGGSASPWDIDERGENLLSVSHLNNVWQMCD